MSAHRRPHLTLSSRPPACGPLDAREEPTGVQGGARGRPRINRRGKWCPSLHPRSWLLPPIQRQGVTLPLNGGVVLYLGVSSRSELRLVLKNRLEVATEIPSHDPWISRTDCPQICTGAHFCVSQAFFGFRAGIASSTNNASS